MGIALFRRRERRTLTPVGWLVVCAVVLGAAVAVGRCVHPFLSPNAPTGARLLVVEGWIAPEDLDAVVTLFRRGRYEHIVTTGGPVPAWIAEFDHLSFAVLARSYLVRQGIPRDAITAVAATASKRNRTYLSAVAVRKWLDASAISHSSFDLVSVGVHTRRSWYLFREAIGSRVRIGAVALPPSSYDPDSWWSTSEGAKTVVTETIAWLWTALFFCVPDSSPNDEGK